MNQKGKQIERKEVQRQVSASVVEVVPDDEPGATQMILHHQSPSTTERCLRRIGMERLRDVLEDLSKGKKGEGVGFKNWP